jgi:hypothetical protein
MYAHTPLMRTPRTEARRRWLSGHQRQGNVRFRQRLRLQRMLDAHWRTRSGPRLWCDLSSRLTERAAEEEREVRRTRLAAQPPHTAGVSTGDTTERAAAGQRP